MADDIQNNKADLTWLHVHVPKAGGSTLRHLMRRNFGVNFYNSASLLETKQYSRVDVREIVRCHPQYKCISDHKFSFDLPYESSLVNVRALSYVRDPVDRFISRYFFHRHFEEVNCIAQRMSFREFANAELVEQHVHPQTNSQIHFLTCGRSTEDLSLIENSLATGKAYLFPIERFDESCICLETLYPESFPDLSYVRTNVSKRDANISDSERELVLRYLKIDQPVCDLAVDFLNKTLASAFDSMEQRQAALADFKDRCSRRFDNFWPPLKPGQTELPEAYLKYLAEQRGEEEPQAEQPADEESQAEQQAES